MYREKSDSRQYSICTICRRTDHRRGSSEGFMQGVKNVNKTGIYEIHTDHV